MDRRDFLQSAGKLLVALTAPLTGPSHASTGQSAGSAPLSDNGLTIFLCGDVMTGRGIDQALPNPGDPEIHEDYMKSAVAYVDLAGNAGSRIPRPLDFAYIWGAALGELERTRPDFRIVNLETAVTTSDEFWPGKGIHYRMHPANLPALQAAGIDCCALANNHVLDWGYPGLEETLTVLAQTGIATAGAGRDAADAGRPAVLTAKSKARVLVFGAGSGSSGIPFSWSATEGRAGVNFLPDYGSRSVEKIAGQIEAYRRPGDRVVLSVHWGGNWGYDIPAAQRELAHRLIDEAGIDVIHGHSSHHPRGIEVYKNRLILYGCGDFINDYEGIGGRESYRGDLCLMYFVSLDRSGALARLEMKPMRIRDFRLIRATESETAWLADTLDRESRRFGARVELVSAQSMHLAWD